MTGPMATDVGIPDPELEAPHLTDLGNSKRFVNDWRHEVRYVPPWKSWLVWDGARWCMDEAGAAVERAKKTVLAIYREATYAETKEDRERLVKHAVKSEAASRIAATLELAKSVEGIPVDVDVLDADPWLLNVANGVVDLRTGTLSPPSPSRLITKLAPVAYDATATCPQWEAFLAQVMAGNETLVRFLQKTIGYALTGDTREQAFFILFGAGSNGKSTFLEVVSALLGDYARRAPIETFMTKQFDTISNDIARLQGARFVATSEAESQRRLAEALVKSLTGGEQITARFLHREFFTFTPRFKIFMATNHKPVVRGSEHAIWRRIRLVPFTVTIPDDQQDRELPAKLAAELPGILRWAVEGCRMWRDEGLGLPDEVRVATEDYRAEMDVLGTFLTERCDLGATLTITAETLYRAYAAWCQQSGERAMTKTALGRALAERGFLADRSRQIGRFWTGLTLSADGSDPSPREPGDEHGLPF